MEIKKVCFQFAKIIHGTHIQRVCYCIKNCCLLYIIYIYSNFFLRDSHLVSANRYTFIYYLPVNFHFLSVFVYY